MHLGPLAKPRNVKACALDDEGTAVLTWSYDSFQEGLFFTVSYGDGNLQVINVTINLHIIIPETGNNNQIFRVRAETPASASDWSEIIYGKDYDQWNVLYKRGV